MPKDGTEIQADAAQQMPPCRFLDPGFDLFAGFLDFRLEFLVVIFVCSPVFLWIPSTKVVWEKFSVPKMASPEARKKNNQDLLSKYRCVPKIGFGFKLGFEKGFRYKVCFFFCFVFAGFLDFRLEFLVVIFVCSPVFLWNPSTKVVWENFWCA